jgi:phosphatidylserine/phosphatidylglycerophosphate/cardiolipin synthase-like enzyme
LFPEVKESGGVIARVIPDGPDADFDNLRLTLLAALAEAQTSVRILTPYFLPDIALVSALNLAAARGAGGRRSAFTQQSALRPLGIEGNVVAGAGARVPYLAHPSAL